MKQLSSSIFHKTAIAVALSAASLAAQALSFECVTGSTGAGADAAGCTTLGESLASWSLVGNILTISNATAPDNASFISGISFDAGAGQTVSLVTPMNPGVLFTTGGGAHLPSSLGWTVDFDFQADKKPATNGVNAGESIAFQLGGVTLSDISHGDFKFGLHIQGLPEGRSEKLITTVPEASSYAMVFGGLGVVGLLARRRKAAQA